MLIERKYGENRRVKMKQKLKFLAVFRYSVYTMRNFKIFKVRAFGSIKKLFGLKNSILNSLKFSEIYFLLKVCEKVYFENFH